MVTVIVLSTWFVRFFALAGYLDAGGAGGGWFGYNLVS